MGKIDVEVSNIGGIEKMKASLQIGSLNIVKGKSSSGKSSLMRGIHLGIVGRPPMEEIYEEEAQTLHLNDSTSDDALLLRGASSGSVSISTPSGKMSATIPKSGTIKGTNSVPKGLFTTMLSALPPTRLYGAVHNANPDDPNNFHWVLGDLTTASNYQTWHNALNSLDKEVKIIRTNFNKWKSSLEGAGARHGEITKELETISQRIIERSESRGADEKELAKDIASARSIETANQKEFHRLDADFRVTSSANAHQSRRKANAEIELKTATRVLDEAEDLLEMEFVEPDTTKLDAEIAAAEEEVEKASGASLSGAHRNSNTVYQDERDKILGASPRFVKAHDPVIGESGDSEAHTAALDKLESARSKRNSIVGDYLDKKRRFGLAEQQAAAARADIQSARATIREAEQSMTIDSGTLETMKEKRDNSERQYKAASKTRKKLEADQSTDDPEDIADQKAQRELLDELANLESTTSFDIRFASLNELPVQTRTMSQEAAETLLGSGEVGKANETLIKTHLLKSEFEIRALLIAEIDRGLLHDLSATSVWAAEEADRQSQETRRVFNEVGTTLFKRLKFSPFTSVSLNTDYQLEIGYPDGTTSGLTGAGGERLIIAAAILIAMRKAYTPEVPILMFDGVLESLDPKPRKELLSFLGEYAKTEGIAVVVSEFDSGEAVATVMTV